MERLGLSNDDGKIEFGLDTQRGLLVVDAVGTLDECRFSYQEKTVSKEAARIFYRRSTWYKEVQRAKEEDPLRWRERVGIPPPPLPQGLLEAISHLYQAFTQELTQREWFGDVPSLKEALERVEEKLEGGRG
mgnify:CR=1 FL=1